MVDAKQLHHACAVQPDTACTRACACTGDHRAAPVHALQVYALRHMVVAANEGVHGDLHLPGKKFVPVCQIACAVFGRERVAVDQAAFHIRAKAPPDTVAAASVAVHVSQALETWPKVPEGKAPVRGPDAPGQKEQVRTCGCQVQAGIAKGANVSKVSLLFEPLGKVAGQDRGAKVAIAKRKAHLVVARNKEYKAWARAGQGEEKREAGSTVRPPVHKIAKQDNAVAPVRILCVDMGEYGLEGREIAVHIANKPQMRHKKPFRNPDASPEAVSGKEARSVQGRKTRWDKLAKFQIRVRE